MSLILPKHQADNLRALKEAAVAQSIAQTAVHRYDSDDFVTPSDVTSQLAQLQEYISLRREEQPDYSLPKPSGWKMMLLMLSLPETSAGGVIITDDSKEQRAMSSPQGIVLALGPAAYTDEDRFSVNGKIAPWHEVGDRIMLVKYDASFFQIANGQRLAFITDTQPIGTIDKGWAIPC